MERTKRNPAKFETLAIFRMLSRTGDYTFTAPETSLKFFEDLKTEFERARDNPQLLFGLRTEAMFGYIAAALGWCKLVKREDAGTIYSSEPDLALPDYRIVLNTGQELFIEVKNKFQKDPEEPCYFKMDYIKKLHRYAETFGKELNFAIYWTNWNIWTLTSILDLSCKGKTFYLPFYDALEFNQMSILGDCYIGTTPPLVLKIVADSTKPQTIEPESIAFVSRSWEFYCGGAKIGTSSECGLAWFLIDFGDWKESSSTTMGDSDQLVSIEYSYEPEVRHNQGFEIIGKLSGIISRYYKSSIAPEGIIEHLEAENPPSFWGLKALSDYQGQTLPLWRFFWTPSHKTTQQVTDPTSPQ